MNKKQTRILGLCWISLLVAGGVWLWERPWPPVLTGQSPLPTATPAGPTPIPTPEFCISQHHDCVLLEFLGYQHNGDGTTTLRYRITNYCTEQVKYFAIETGFWTRLAPADGATYQGDLGSYTVHWVDDQPGIPTQGLRFDGAIDAFKEGAAEVYTFTVRDFTPRSPNTGRVVVGRREYAFRLILLDPTCEVGVWPTPRPTPTLTSVPFSPLPTPTSTPDGGVVLPTAPVVAACVFGPPAGGLPTEEPIIPLSVYSFSAPQLALANTAPIKIHQWLPDNETLLISRESGISQTVSVDLVNISTGEVTEVVEPRGYLQEPMWLVTDQTVFWKELGPFQDETFNINEPGYWSRSFTPPSERRLSGDGRSGWSVTHDVSPDDKKFVFLSLPGGTQPLIWNQETKMLHALSVDLANWRYQNGPIYPFQPFYVDWQPSGENLLFWDGTWLFLYELSNDRGCEIRLDTLISTPFTFVQEAAWSPNGRYLLLKNAEYPPYTMTSGPHDLVLILDIYTGEAVQYALGNLIVNLAWAPDSQTIVMTKKTGEETDSYGRFNLYGFFLFNGRSGETRQILPEQEGGGPKRLLWSPDGTLLTFLGMIEDKSGNTVGGVLVSQVTQSR